MELRELIPTAWQEKWAPKVFEMLGLMGIEFLGIETLGKVREHWHDAHLPEKAAKVEQIMFKRGTVSKPMLPQARSMASFPPHQPVMCYLGCLDTENLATEERWLPGTTLDAKDTSVVVLFYQRVLKPFPQVVMGGFGIFYSPTDPGIMLAEDYYRLRISVPDAELYVYSDGDSEENKRLLLSLLSPLPTSD
ncbi:MAG: hypothetical protein HYW33_02755 [Candidatus Blackburnbacteria bacterium]|nr:hypothetical protein [Candidatus Blackburnbacteria bacterium]